MNRLVLIGNGFDLAHGLKTSYADFILWYWKRRILGLSKEPSKTSKDKLCSLSILQYNSWEEFHFHNQFKLNLVEVKDFYTLIHDKQLFHVDYSPLFARIHHSFETKGWVDIENDYYHMLKEFARDGAPEKQVELLHAELQFLQNMLVEYLQHIDISDKFLSTEIRQKIYAPLKKSDISIYGQRAMKNHIKSGLNLAERAWDWKLGQFNSICYSRSNVEDYKKKNKSYNSYFEQDEPPIELMLPNQVMLLNFNYTSTAQMYCKINSIFTVNQIHGKLDNPESVIFGYGDELDASFKILQDLNDNECLRHIKSFRYLDSDNYRRMQSFIESEPYQILIMGHSCGNSDRTLLNTLFEHKNCVSIKPYYYIKEDGTDNYLELVQNISRNFTDMKLMRDRVVNKTYCEPLLRKIDKQTD